MAKNKGFMPINKRLTHQPRTKKVAVGKTLDHPPFFYFFSLKKKNNNKKPPSTANARRHRHCSPQSLAPSPTTRFLLLKLSTFHPSSTQTSLLPLFLSLLSFLTTPLLFWVSHFRHEDMNTSFNFLTF
jgi:hypothetical protein